VTSRSPTSGTGDESAPPNRPGPVDRSISACQPIDSLSGANTAMSSANPAATPAARTGRHSGR
jgi:hypothetical protein